MNKIIEAIKFIINTVFELLKAIWDNNIPTSFKDFLNIAIPGLGTILGGLKIGKTLYNKLKNKKQYIQK